MDFKKKLSEMKNNIMKEANALEKELVQIMNRENYIRNRLEQLKGSYETIESLEKQSEFEGLKEPVDISQIKQEEKQQY